MNATQQAKNGLKTFIVTFLGSLLIFGSFYYFLLEASSKDVNVEESASIAEQSPQVVGDTEVALPAQVAEQVTAAPEEPVVEPADVMGATAQVEEATLSEPAYYDNEEETVEEAMGASPFAYLAAQEVNTEQKAVLAGTSQTTQSSVPSTGMTSVTVGFIVSTGLFSFFLYMIFLNPRRYALSKFERTVVKDLEK